MHVRVYVITYQSYIYKSYYFTYMFIANCILIDVCGLLMCVWVALHLFDLRIQHVVDLQNPFHAVLAQTHRHPSLV